MKVPVSFNISTFGSRFVLLLLFLLCGSITSVYSLPERQRVDIEKFIYDGSYRKALTIIEDLMPIYSDDAEIYLFKGICLYNLNKRKIESIDVLKNGLIQKPEENIKRDILFHLGKAYAINKDYANAIKTYYTLENQVPSVFESYHDRISDQIDEWSNILEKQGELIPQKPISGLPSDSRVQNGKANSTQNSKKANIINASTTASPQIPEDPSKQYTIQICTMSSPVADLFLNGSRSIRVIKSGDLYRYIYSQYNSLQAARNDLPKIRKIYPEAFIREISNNKLGQAIDLQTDQIK